MRKRRRGLTLVKIRRHPLLVFLGLLGQASFGRKGPFYIGHKTLAGVEAVSVVVSGQVRSNDHRPRDGEIPPSSAQGDRKPGPLWKTEPAIRLKSGKRRKSVNVGTCS